MRLHILWALSGAHAFHFQGPEAGRHRGVTAWGPAGGCSTPRASAKTRRRVFDFFRDRAKEGFEQLENVVTKTREGKFAEAVRDAAEYSAETNEKFYEGLARWVRWRQHSDVDTVGTQIGH